MAQLGLARAWMSQPEPCQRQLIALPAERRDESELLGRRHAAIEVEGDLVRLGRGVLGLGPVAAHEIRSSRGRAVCHENGTVAARRRVTDAGPLGETYVIV